MQPPVHWLARVFSVLCALAGISALILGLWLEALLLLGGTALHEVLVHRYPPVVLPGARPRRR